MYCLCDQRGIDHNARAFGERCAEALDDVLPAVDGFEAAFEYLVESGDAIPSTFQRIIDEVLDGTDVSLVLLGSSTSIHLSAHRNSSHKTYRPHTRFTD